MKIPSFKGHTQDIKGHSTTAPVIYNLKDTKMKVPAIFEIKKVKKESRNREQ